MGEHRRMNDCCTLLNKSIAKNGWGAFKHRIIFQGWMDQKHRNQLETQFIAFYDTFGRGKGYNLTRGGKSNSGYKWTDKQRAKFKASHSGKNHCNYGKKMSKETRAKIGKASKGNKHSLGVIPSAETRAKMRAAHIGRDYKNSGRKGKRCFGKMAGEDEWREFDSSQSAADAFGISPSYVANGIAGRHKRPKYCFKR